MLRILCLFFIFLLSLFFRFLCVLFDTAEHSTYYTLPMLHLAAHCDHLQISVVVNLLSFIPDVDGYMLNIVC